MSYKIRIYDMLPYPFTLKACKKVKEYSQDKNNTTLDVDSIGKHVDDYLCESVGTLQILKSFLAL